MARARLSKALVCFGVPTILFTLYVVILSSTIGNVEKVGSTDSIHEPHPFFRVQHNPSISSVGKDGDSIESFSESEDEAADTLSEQERIQEQKVLEWAEQNDRLPIVKILQQGRYHLSDTKIFTPEMLERLPKWSDVVDFYGPPKVLGLERCQAYRDTVQLQRRKLGVAGFFNSGTNLLYALLLENCYISKADRNGVFWQVPWGKHYFAHHRGRPNPRYPPRESNVTEYMPVVSVRDPYTWLQSMCRQPYQTRFDHIQGKCPNIIPYPEDLELHPRYAQWKYMPTFTRYTPELEYKHESIVHLWNDWYETYSNRTYAHLTVRMEDLIFHGSEVIPQMCECVGAKTKRGKFLHSRFVQNNNRGIEKVGTMTGLLKSIINYGNITKRREGYSNIQLEAAKLLLNRSLMDTFRYPMENT